MKVVSVTITFRPDLAALERQLSSLRQQLTPMLVIDNGPYCEPLAAVCQQYGAQLMSLGSNTGIGFAQNRGIEQALAMGAEAVLLLDQDSEPQDGMVQRLVAALANNSHAAATGASSIDLRTGQQSFFEVDTGGWPGRWRPPSDAGNPTVEAAYLIASGCLLRSQALETIGLMREEWFIDLIDNDWSLRARAQGWVLLGVANAQLGHRLGDKVSTIWLGRCRQVPHHSPLRNYYMFRNALLLLREPHVPRHWQRYHLTRLVQLFGYFLLLAPQRWLRLKMMMQGLFDGLRGKTGPWA